MEQKPIELTFWEHLDDLRSVLIRILVATAICGFVAFLLKDQIFVIVLAPKDDGFITYQLLNHVSRFVSGADPAPFLVKLVNTNLTEQFMVHIRIAVWFGIVSALPYILYQIFLFVSPALYGNERRYALKMISCSYIMFMVGILISYFLIFPLTFRFLGTYQVSNKVESFISIKSYIDTLLLLSFAMGFVFEMPILSLLLARLGVVSSGILKKYRKKAAVVILVISATITPTSDVFTLLLVALPMFVLYEVSILVIRAPENYEQPVLHVR